MEGVLLSTKESVAGGPRLAGAGRLWVIWVLVLVSLLFRFWYISFRQLVEDEAVYWSWSRHLAGGYLDHPPLVAYLIHWSVSLFGTNEFGVRFFSPLLATASLAVLLFMAGRVLHDRRALVWLGIIWLTSPLLAGLGTLMTPDPPSIFFSLCALACVVVVLTPEGTAACGFAPEETADNSLRNENCSLSRHCPENESTASSRHPERSEGSPLSRKKEILRCAQDDGSKPSIQSRSSTRGGNNTESSPSRALRGFSAVRDPLLWLGFGIFCGAAFISKYTTILLPASVGLAFLTSPQGRRQLCRPWPYLSALPAIAIFLPVILWNRDHHWASFLYQLHHGLEPSKQSLSLAAKILKALLGLGRYIGAELLVWTPVLFVAGIGVMAAFWRRYRSLPAADRLLLWSATVPLVFFGISATRAQSEANWPAFAYFPLSVLMVRWMAQTWDKGRIGLIRTGCIVAAVGLVVLQAPEVLGLLTPPKWRSRVMGKFDQLYGWRDLGRAIGAANDGRLIVAERYQDAAQISFYAPGRPEVWPVGDGKRAHRSAFAFDYFEPKPDFDTVPGVLFVGFHYEWMDDKYGLKRTKMEWATGSSLSGQPRRIPVMFLDRRKPQTRPD
jgi:4-amino-4-deoxy-L-arabinose transferase-like glycosyltransferase